MKEKLAGKGVVLINPDSIEIAPEVNPDRIEQGVVIHPGCRIRGADTFLCSGTEIGKEAPVTVENCYAGPEVSLQGGYFKGSVFLTKASVGSCAHIRDGTILEEHAGAAHNVGLKQTILFPFVTLGSIINFCDCLMAGGTGPDNHSEVGSSYIHFNFTPRQDKATPSLIGDVAKGVMLNQPPVFLGGQGGLVGPCRLAYGTVIAAGTINRRDEHRSGRLIFGGPDRSGNIPYEKAGGMRNISRVVENNLFYIASLNALRCWYTNVRAMFISESLPEPLYQGLLHTLDGCIEERIRRFDKFAAGQVNQYNGRELFDPESVQGAGEVGDSGMKENFLAQVNRQIQLQGKQDYTGVIQSLDPADADLGSSWLQGIIDALAQRWKARLPGLFKT
ncbi:MAG: protein GlmU [Desulfosalsimonas sp.]